MQIYRTKLRELKDRATRALNRGVSQSDSAMLEELRTTIVLIEEIEELPQIILSLDDESAAQVLEKLRGDFATVAQLVDDKE